MIKKRKKILYLGNKLSKHGKTPTGIDFLTPKLRELGFNVIAVSDKKNKIFRLLHMWKSIIQHKRNVDMILIDTYSTLNFYYAFTSAILAKSLKIPYICILRGGDLPSRIRNHKKKSEKLFLNSKTNIALSYYLLEAFKQQGFQNVQYIPNPIPLKNYTFQKREVLVPRLLWVRSFAEIYNPSLAIEILAQLKKYFPQAELCMVGPEKDGSLESCRRLAQSKHLQVKFTGKLSKEKWIALSSSYNIFINTTNFDNTPVSVIEAMALGLPVVSTNVGGLPYLIADQHDGVLVQKDNESLFVAAIEKIIDTPGFTKKITVNARKKVESFDWEVVKEKWDDVLK